MSIILKSILAEENRRKMRDIFERAKGMDTVEIYDELYGIPPPPPPPACARLPFIESVPLWNCGIIWSPDGNHRHIQYPGWGDLESWREAVDKALATPLPPGRGYFGMIPSQMPNPIPILSTFELRPDGQYRIGYEMDFRVKIVPFSSRRSDKVYRYGPRPWKYRHRCDAMHAFQKSKYPLKNRPL